MRKELTVAVLSLLFSGVSAIAEETADMKKYKIPDEVDCSVRKNDRVTVCLDKTGQKITGVLTKYAEGTLIRTYPLKDGILQGTATAYYISGGTLWEKPYIDGKLNGTVKKYYKSGGVESAEPYKDGKKEGVAKYYYENGTMLAQGIYIGGKRNGSTRFYTKEGVLSAEFNSENNRFISGFSYQDVKDANGNKKTDSDGKVVTEKHAFTQEELQEFNNHNSLIPIKGFSEL